MNDKKTKIIYCVTKSVLYGAQKYILEMASALSKDDFDVAVATGGNGILIDKLKERGIRTVPIPSIDRDIKLFKELKSFKEILDIFKKERPDIIHLNSSKMGGIGALAGRIAGVKKIIFTAHGWPFNENRNFISKVLIWFASYLSALLATEVIVIDEKDFRQAKQFPFCKNKITLIHNGIKPFDFFEREISRKVLIEKIGQNPFKGKIVIGTTAELHNNKGLKYGIEAISLLPWEIQQKLSYIIIGEGEERSNLELLIRQKRLEDKVYLPGFMDDAKKYLGAFDIFMFPSLKEGLPYALLEAGFASLPIITTKVGGIPDIIGDLKSEFIVEPKRADELARVLLELIENKKVRDSLSKKNRENILAKFTFEKMFNKTLKLYKY